VSGGLLASVELQVHGSARWGRIFLPVEQLRENPLQHLTVMFNRDFIEPNEAKRFALLEQALRDAALTVETYPGETPPEELHVYLRAAQVSEFPIFACVLAPPAVVKELVSQPPHFVMETASLQVMEGDVTNAQVLAAIEAWIGRVWPEIRVPTLRLSPWPGPVEEKERALDDFLRPFRPGALPAEWSPQDALPFSPPSDLVDKNFLPPPMRAA
jgi:hypothetical protein